MATIVKRKDSYAVVYNYKNEEGEIKQKWETYHTAKEAKDRRIEIENQLNKNEFVLPTKMTVSNFMDDFVTLYGEKQWSLSMYDTCSSLIENYVKPIIGDMEVQSITPRVVDKYVQQLQKTKPVDKRFRKAKTEYVTPATIEKIIKLLRHAFKQAIRWEMITRNPFDGAVLPRVEHKQRDIWTADIIKQALEMCKDDKLYMAMHLAFACSLRIGEIVGLTWDNVDISEKAIMNDDAFIEVKYELARETVETMEKLNYRGIKFVFPPLLVDSKTRLVLKEPKTKSSVRKVWLPKTLAYILVDWKKKQEDAKELLGEEYYDYNLVVSLSNGNPCENRVMSKSFQKLKKNAGLPDVVFHSLRHSSATYKLELNDNIKDTQGDTGHATTQMLLDTYAKILDKNRKLNAQKFDNVFYTSKSKNNQVESEQKELDDKLLSLMGQLKKSPELVEIILKMINVQNSQIT
ncbi:MAG: tyrosine-type recombinase/integrase [Coprobacillaceae bacterium]